MNKKIMLSAAVGAFFVANLSAATVTVSPGDTHGWFARGTNENGELRLSTDEPYGPGNTGSLKLVTTDNSNGSIVQAARVSVVTVDKIRAMEYCYSTTDTLIPKIKVEYWQSQQNGGRSGTLVSIPTSNVTDGSWQCDDAMTLQWWSTEFGSGEVHDITWWENNLTGIASNYFEVGMGSTGGTVAATAYVDMVRFSVERSSGVDDNTYDFEGEAQMPPENPTAVPFGPWGLLAMGLLFGIFGVRKLNRT